MNRQLNLSVNAGPWYRHRWPWFLMAGPFLVVVASFVTLWLAIRSNDGLVSEDYYQQGLAVNRTLARSERAKALGMVAAIRLEQDVLSVQLTSQAPFFKDPARLHVTLSHATRAGLEQSQLLPRDGDGYSGKVRLPAEGHWLVMVEDEEQTWRLLGNLVLPSDRVIVLGGN